jgi:GGDEF domain-containing protein
MQDLAAANERAHVQLRTDYLTGLYNKQNWEEKEAEGPPEVRAHIDGDSLKWINDNMGHERGDAFLKAIGDAARAEGLAGDDVYSLMRAGEKGDEFYMGGKDKADVDAKVERLRARLKSTVLTYTLTDGTVLRYTGVEITHGVGKTKGEADANLAANKAERERTGLRAGREAEPPGVVRIPPAGREAGVLGAVGAPAEEAKPLTPRQQRLRQRAGVEKRESQAAKHQAAARAASPRAAAQFPKDSTEWKEWSLRRRILAKGGNIDAASELHEALLWRGDVEGAREVEGSLNRQSKEARDSERARPRAVGAELPPPEKGAPEETPPNERSVQLARAADNLAWIRMKGVESAAATGEAPEPPSPSETVLANAIRKLENGEAISNEEATAIKMQRAVADFRQAAHEGNRAPGAPGIERGADARKVIEEIAAGKRPIEDMPKPPAGRGGKVVRGARTAGYDLPVVDERVMREAYPGANRFTNPYPGIWVAHTEGMKPQFVAEVNKIVPEQTGDTMISGYRVTAAQLQQMIEDGEVFIAGSSSGAIKGSTAVLLAAQRWDPSTVRHEPFHTTLAVAFANDPQRLQNFYSKLKDKMESRGVKNITLAQAEEFGAVIAEHYNPGTQKWDEEWARANGLGPRWRGQVGKFLHDAHLSFRRMASGVLGEDALENMISDISSGSSWRQAAERQGLIPAGHGYQQAERAGAGPVYEQRRGPGAEPAARVTYQFGKGRAYPNRAREGREVPTDLEDYRTPELRDLDEAALRMYDKKYSELEPDEQARVEGEWEPLRKLGESPGFMLQVKEAPAPIFYSKLQRTLEEKMPRSTPVDQLRGLLGSARVKDEEIAWSGIDDFLAPYEAATDPKGRQVPRGALLDYLRANQVEVREVMKGERELPPGSKVKEWLRSALPRGETSLFSVYDSDGVELGRGPTREAALQDARTGENVPPAGVFGTRAAKFSQYTLPGGENYRELLLTMPPPVLPEGAYPELTVPQKTRQVQLRNQPGGLTDAQAEELKTLNRQEQLAQDRSCGPSFVSCSAWSSLWSRPRQGFVGSHWDEPNVLAHVRFNDRTDADGKRVLFLEEVQSDWHQKGREVGYAGGENSAAYYVEPSEAAGKWNVIRRSNGQIFGMYHTKEAAEDAARSNSAANAPPDAPFKKSWPELSMKRMIRYAAENGYDKIAWTTGEQQAERYDLSKQVDIVSFFRDKDGTYQVEARKWTDIRDPQEAVDEGESEVLLAKRGVSAKDLPGLVGKDLAQKAIDMPFDHDSFAGEDLAIGGEGMRGFYDQILPEVANKIGKRFGARAGETDIGTGKPGANLAIVENVGFRKPFEVHLGDQFLQSFKTRGEAEKFIVENQREIILPVDREKAHSLDITPSMRESVMTEGQPLFQVKEARARLSLPKIVESNLTEEELGSVENQSRESTVKKVIRAFKDGLSPEDMTAVAQAGRAVVGGYKETGELFRHLFGPEAERFSALWAAMSPRQSVKFDYLMTLNIWDRWNRAHVKGKPPDGNTIKKIVSDAQTLFPESFEGMTPQEKESVLMSRVNNGIKVLMAKTPQDALEVLSGPKVRPFGRAPFDLSQIVLDTWQQVLSLQPGLMNSKPIRLAVRALMRETAKRLDMQPAEVQEATWGWIKPLIEMARGLGRPAASMRLYGKQYENLNDAERSGVEKMVALGEDQGLSEMRGAQGLPGSGDIAGALDALTHEMVRDTWNQRKMLLSENDPDNPAKINPVRGALESLGLLSRAEEFFSNRPRVSDLTGSVVNPKNRKQLLNIARRAYDVDAKIRQRLLGMKLEKKRVEFIDRLFERLPDDTGDELAKTMRSIGYWLRRAEAKEKLPSAVLDKRARAMFGRTFSELDPVDKGNVQEAHGLESAAQRMYKKRYSKLTDKERESVQGGYRGLPRVLGLRLQFDAARGDAALGPDGEYAQPPALFQVSESIKRTPEFEQWFADSKIVDKNGEPRVVYHGTKAAEDFVSFITDPEKQFGAHFGSTPAAANIRIGAGYEEIRTARRRERQGYEYNRPPSRIIPAHLSIKNPATLPDLGDFRGLEAWRHWFALDEPAQPSRPGVRASKIDPDVWRIVKETHDAFMDADEHWVLWPGRVRGALEDAGYDGAMYKNAQEGIGRWSYIAFHPEQIKGIFNESPTGGSEYMMQIKGAPRVDLMDRERTPLLNEDYAILTANKAGKTPEENARAMKSLEKILRDSYGLDPVATTGMYGTPEPGFLIQGLRPQDYLVLGKKFRQESVLMHFADPAMQSGLWYTTGPNAGRIAPAQRDQITFDQETPDFYTQLETPDGPVKFQLPIDFDNLVDQPKGRLWHYSVAEAKTLTEQGILRSKFGTAAAGQERTRIAGTPGVIHLYEPGSTPETRVTRGAKTLARVESGMNILPLESNLAQRLIAQEAALMRGPRYTGPGITGGMAERAQRLGYDGISNNGVVQLWRDIKPGDIAEALPSTGTEDLYQVQGRRQWMDDRLENNRRRIAAGKDTVSTLQQAKDVAGGAGRLGRAYQIWKESGASLMSEGWLKGVEGEVLHKAVTMEEFVRNIAARDSDALAAVEQAKSEPEQTDLTQFQVRTAEQLRARRYQEIPDIGRPSPRVIGHEREALIAAGLDPGAPPVDIAFAKPSGTGVDKFPLNLTKISDAENAAIEAKLVAAMPDSVERVRPYRSDDEVLRDAERLGVQGVGLAEVRRLRAAGVLTPALLVRGGIIKENAARALRSAWVDFKGALGTERESEARVEYAKKSLEAATAILQTLEMRNEAGRALAALNIMNKATDPHTQAIRILKQRGFDDPGKMVLITNVPEGNSAELIKVVKGLLKPSLSSMLQELAYSGMMSGIPTHLRNMTSNTFAGALKHPERALAGILDQIRSTVTGKGREIYAREAIEQLAALDMTTLRQALQSFRGVWNETGPTDWGKLELGHEPALPGKLGKFIRGPLRAASAEDAFFNTISMIQEMNAQAYRIARKEGLKTPEAIAERMKYVVNNAEEFPEALAAAEKARRYWTFQSQPGPIAQSLLNLAQTKPLLRLFVAPFIKTPANLLHFAYERTPIALANNVYKMMRNRVSWAEGAESMSRGMIGSAILGAFVAGAMRGLITGMGPKDNDERRNLERTGWAQYSLKLGDAYYSYRGVEPISTWLMAAANFVEAANTRDQEKVIDELMRATRDTVFDKTYLQGFEQLALAVSDPQRYGEGWVRQAAGMAVPAIVGRAAMAVDETTRRSPAGAGYAQRIAESVARKVPFVSTTFPERVSATGESIPKVGSPLTRFLSPFQRSAVREGAELELEFNRIGWTPASAPRDLVDPRTHKKFKLTEEETKLYEEAFRSASDVSRKMILDPGYLSLPDDPETPGINKAKRLRHIYDMYRLRARNKILNDRWAMGAQ